MAHGSVSNLLTAAARLHQIFNGLDLHSVLGSKRHSWRLAAAALEVQGGPLFEEWRTELWCSAGRSELNLLVSRKIDKFEKIILMFILPYHVTTAFSLLVYN